MRIQGQLHSVLRICHHRLAEKLNIFLSPIVCICVSLSLSVRSRRRKDSTNNVVSVLEKKTK